MQQGSLHNGTERIPFGISEARTGGVYKQLLLSKHTARVENKIKIIKIKRVKD